MWLPLASLPGQKKKNDCPAVIRKNDVMAGDLQQIAI